MFIPLRVDVPTWRVPWTNYALMAAIIVVSLVGFADVGFFCRLAGIELTYGGTARLTTVRHSLVELAVYKSFLHGGWLHLIGNMLFLWVFGNAVNYKLGHLWYVVLFLVGSIAGGLAHYLIVQGPVVGASDAIYGVMGAFAVFFPRNNVKVLFSYRVFIWQVLWISSVWVIGIWVVMDLLFILLGVQSGVALWAHFMGFLAGFGLGMVLAWTGVIKPTADEQTLLQVLRGSR